MNLFWWYSILKVFVWNTFQNTAVIFQQCTLGKIPRRQVLPCVNVSGIFPNMEFYSSYQSPGWWVWVTSPKSRVRIYLYHNALKTGMALNMDVALKCAHWLTGTWLSPLGSVAVLLAHNFSPLAWGFSLCIKHWFFAVLPASKTNFSGRHPRCLDSEESWQRPLNGPWTFLEKLILITESLD